MHMNTFTVIQQQNIVSYGIYSIFAYLINRLWWHSFTKMVASMSAFSSILKSNNLHIYQQIFIFFHPTALYFLTCLFNVLFLFTLSNLNFALYISRRLFDVWTSYLGYWHQDWPYDICRFIWPIFCSLMILPYILKTIWFINLILVASY